MRRIAVPGLLLAAAIGPATARQASDDTSWYAIRSADGAWIGHGSRAVGPLPDGREIVEVQELRFQERGHAETATTERTVTRLDREGRTLSIVEDRQTGRSRVRVEVRFARGEALVMRRTQSEQRSVRVPLPAGTRFDNGAGLLAGWDPARTPRLEFPAFSLDAMAVERVTIERAPGDASIGGGTMAVLRKRFDGDQLRTVSRLTLDPARRVVAVTQPMFGTSITIAPVARAEALAPHPPYRVLGDALVKAPYRIAPGAMAGQIRYRFAFRDGIAFAPPETGEQRLTMDGDRVVLDICADCGPGLASDRATLADALRATPWLQSDSPRIRRLAQGIARLKVSDTRKMEMLRENATGYLGRVDFAGHYSALEYLERGAGDCTEAAVLLAALGRAAGIPTRVANGLVYSRERYHGVSNAFMPHSWTLAYVDGRWRSFDLALEHFDATHIALTIGDGDARSIGSANQLAGLLRWETMGEVRRKGP